MAVDVDEVLGRFVHALNGFCAEEEGMWFDTGDYHEYVFHKVWGVSAEESTRIVHAFYKSHHFLSGVHPIEGSFDTLRRLSELDNVRLVVVTSRQTIIRQETCAWLDRHFPSLFQQTHFGNQYSLGGASRTKREICEEIGADVLIDDNPEYALECADAGIDVVLFDRYPWSRLPAGRETHPRISVASDWAQVERTVSALRERVV